MSLTRSSCRRQPWISLRRWPDRVGVTLERCRLILLGYDDAIRSGVLPSVEEEQVDRTVSPRDLVEFFCVSSPAAPARRLRGPT